MPEKADNPLDRLFHPEEIGEFRIDLDRAVHEDATEPRVLARVDHRRLANRLQHALGGAGVERRVVGTFPEVIFDRQLDLAPVVVEPRIELENSVIQSHLTPRPAQRSPQQPEAAATDERRETKNIRRHFAFRSPPDATTATAPAAGPPAKSLNGPIAIDRASFRKVVERNQYAKPLWRYYGASRQSATDRDLPAKPLPLMRQCAGL